MRSVIKHNKINGAPCTKYGTVVIIPLILGSVSPFADVVCFKFRSQAVYNSGKRRIYLVLGITSSMKSFRNIGDVVVSELNFCVQKGIFFMEDTPVFGYFS